MPRNVKVALLILLQAICASLSAHAFQCGDVVHFEEGIPLDWQSLDYEGNDVVWVTSEDVNCTALNQTGESGESACIDAQGRPSSWSGLRSSIFSLQGMTSSTLEFHGAMHHVNRNDFLVLWSWTSSNGFQQRLGWQENHSDELVAVNLDALAGEDEVFIEFAYFSDANGGWLQVDAIRLICSDAPQSSVSGRVTDEETGDPLSSAFVVVEDMIHNGVGFGVTNEEGVYDISVPPGSYLVTAGSDVFADELFEDVSCPLGFLCDQTEGTLVTVMEGTTTSGIDFSLTRGGFISGIVTDTGTGEPVSDVVVFLEVPEVPGKGAGRGANFQGVYEIGPLPSRDYFARARPFSDKYIPQYYDGVSCPGFVCPDPGDLIQVVAPDTVMNIDFALEVSPDFIFGDGFESGTTASWSTVIP